MKKLLFILLFIAIGGILYSALDFGGDTFQGSIPSEALKYKLSGDTKLGSEAIDDYTQAINIYPEYDTAYLNRGIRWANLNNPNKAFEDFNRVIAINPKFTCAYNYRARTRDLDDRELIIADYMKAIELEGDCIEFYSSLANYYYEIKEYDNALENYRIAIHKFKEYTNRFIPIFSIINSDGERVYLTDDDLETYLIKTFYKDANITNSNKLTFIPSLIETCEKLNIKVYYKQVNSDGSYEILDKNKIDESKTSTNDYVLGVGVIVYRNYSKLLRDLNLYDESLNLLTEALGYFPYDGSFYELRSLMRFLSEPSSETLMSIKDTFIGAKLGDKSSILGIKSFTGKL